MKVAMFVDMGKIETQQIPTPKIGPGEALIKVDACAVCATDVKIVFKGHRHHHPPCVLGHEIAGRVAEVNGDVPVQVGQRVVVSPLMPCGHCYFCARGEETMCENLFAYGPDPGGYAEYIRVPAPLARSGIIPIPDTLPSKTASLAEAIACAIRCVRDSGVKPGSVVAVVGDGPMGMFNAAAARAYGAGSVIMTGLSEQRLAIAARHYADVTVDVSRDDPQAKVRSVTSGYGADVVIVTAAALPAVKQGMGLVRRGGTVNVFAGQPAGSLLDVDVAEIHYSEINLTGTFSSTPATMREALALASTRVDFSPIITAEFPIEGFIDALTYSKEMRGLRPIVVMD